jgi:RNA polymerase sigma factor (sigma-70 family)
MSEWLIHARPNRPHRDHVLAGDDGDVEPSDGELVWLARSGDAEALAVLLARHRAAMHAVAVARLGAGPDIDDVVQDATLVAISSLDRLRDPQLAKPWLTGITRNLCLGRIRGVGETPLYASPLADPSPGPEERLERTAVRDWVWRALDALSEPLRHVVVLRYFSTASSYADIAAALGVPVGTVRSRLSDARRALALTFDEHARRADGSHARLVQERASLFASITQQYNRGVELDSLRNTLLPTATLSAAGSGDVYVGPHHIVHSLAGDVEAGVRLRLLNVVAGPGITVVEGAFENPLDDPEHCPPLTTQVFTHRGNEIASIYLHYSWV